MFYLFIFQLSDDSVDLQLQHLHQESSEIEKVEQLPTKIDNRNNDDVHENKSNKSKSSDSKKVIEYLSEVDGIIVKTEGEDRGDDDKYVISELEIVENSNSDMQLEEGTILNTSDGGIIKVLQHEGKNIIQDEEGNFYRANEDGNVSDFLIKL